MKLGRRGPIGRSRPGIRPGWAAAIGDAAGVLSNPYALRRIDADGDRRRRWVHGAAGIGAHYRDCSVRHLQVGLRERFYGDVQAQAPQAVSVRGSAFGVRR